MRIQNTVHYFPLSFEIRISIFFIIQEVKIFARFLVYRGFWFIFMDQLVDGVVTGKPDIVRVVVTRRLVLKTRDLCVTNVITMFIVW